MSVDEDDYTSSEVRELAKLPDEALTAFEEVERAMVALESKVGDLSVGKVLVDAWNVREALNDYAHELSDKRHRLRKLVRDERLRRERGKAV